MPLSLSIKVSDRLFTGFSLMGKSTPEIISAVSKSSASGQNVYTVTVPSGVYLCSPNNTTVQEKSLVGIDTWVLGA